MKNPGKLCVILSLVALILCVMAACDLDPREPITTPTPVAADFDVANLVQPAGAVTAVTITPKAGRSKGEIKVYYEGAASTAKSATIPQTAGAYAVTFDVAAATGWNAAPGLYAGVLTVGTPTPVAADYVFTRLFQTAGDVRAVEIKPKEGKSKGGITIYYEGTGSTTLAKTTDVPQVLGTYAVTFDVAEATGWKAATGLSAGSLDVNNNQTPKEDNYNITIGNQTQAVGDNVKEITAIVGNVKEIKVEPDPGVGGGAVTVYYEGVAPTTYAKSNTLPTAAGIYAVTVEVAEANGWNPATFYVGTLIIVANLPTPVLDDFIIEGLYKNDSLKEPYTFGDLFFLENYPLKPVKIKAKEGKSPGHITVFYKGTLTDGSKYEKEKYVGYAGTYAVTFDVDEAPGWNEAVGLSAGTLTINKRTISKNDFNDDYDVDLDDINDEYELNINIEIQANNTCYYIPIRTTDQYYEGTSGTTYTKSSDFPSVAGTYRVTFNVDDSNYTVQSKPEFVILNTY